jgi:O-antigen ligase
MIINIFNDSTNEITSKERWLVGLVALFFATFYLPHAPVINNLVILALGVFCFRYNNREEKKVLLKQRPEIYIIIAFNAWQLFSALSSENVNNGLQYLQVRIPLLFFPLTLGLICIKKAVKWRILLVYALVTTLAALVSSIAALVVFSQTGDTGFLYNDSLTDIIDKQSVYFALMVNIAIMIFGYLFIHRAIIPRYRKWFIPVIAFLLIFHFMLASRIEIIFLYSSGIIFALYYFFIKKKNRKAGFVMVGGLLVCAAIFATLFPKTVNRFNELRYPDYNFKNDAVESHYNMKLTADQWNGFNIRLAIWNCGIEVIEEHPVVGTALGDKDQALLNKFEEKHFEFGIRTNKNMHSTYLDMLAGMGIIGLLTFLLGYLVLPMVKALTFRDVIGSLVLIDFGLSFITESYPDRSMGCIIFGFFVSFIIAYKDSSQMSAQK